MVKFFLITFGTHPSLHTSNLSCVKSTEEENTAPRSMAEEEKSSFSPKKALPIHANY